MTLHLNDQIVNVDSRQVHLRWSLISVYASVNSLRNPGANTDPAPVEPTATYFLLLGAYVKILT